MPNLIEHGYPHLDSVVNSLTPCYGTEPFRCTSTRERGDRRGLTSHRECEWALIDEPASLLSPPGGRRFRSNLVLRIYADATRGVDFARDELHTLALGIVSDWGAADRRGTPAQTGIYAIEPNPEAIIEGYEEIEPEGGGEAVAVVISINFILVQGC